MPRVTISEPGKTPQPYRFKLERKEISIGRGSDNDIVIECGSCSTCHCMMQRVTGGYILTDRGSTNGVKLDDTLMQVIDLYDGMEVMVGDIPLKFQLSDDELDTLNDEEFHSHEKMMLPPVDDSKQEDTVARPSTSSPRASHLQHASESRSSLSEGMKTFILLIGIVLAVAIGMSLSHYKRTGDFLPAKLMQD